MSGIPLNAFQLTWITTVLVPHKAGHALNIYGTGKGKKDVLCEMW